MIPDPQVLAAHLGSGALVLVVGGERPFLVAVTGSTESKARMVAAYRRAGLPIQVAADVDLSDPPNHEYQPPQADALLDLSAQGNYGGRRQAEVCGSRGGRPENNQATRRSRVGLHSRSVPSRRKESAAERRQPAPIR
jgi:hypothetical protein